MQGWKRVRENSVVPPGLESLLPLSPALKRWAKLDRPSGARFSVFVPPDPSERRVLTHTLEALLYPKALRSRDGSKHNRCGASLRWTGEDARRSTDRLSARLWWSMFADGSVRAALHRLGQDSRARIPAAHGYLLSLGARLARAFVGGTRRTTTSTSCAVSSVSAFTSEGADTAS
jgi:hypothetical protein